MQLCLRVSLKASFCLISESWCGLGVGNSCSSPCPPRALILGMLALRIPPPATRIGLYPGLLWGSPTVVPVRSSAWKSLLSGVWNPGVRMAAVENPLGTWLVRRCVRLCVLRDDVINGDQCKGPDIFHYKSLSHSSLNSILSVLSISSFHENAFVMWEHACVMGKPQLSIRPAVSSDSVSVINFSSRCFPAFALTS